MGCFMVVCFIIYDCQEIAFHGWCEAEVVAAGSKKIPLSVTKEPRTLLILNFADLLYLYTRYAPPEKSSTIFTGATWLSVPASIISTA